MVCPKETPWHRSVAAPTVRVEVLTKVRREIELSDGLGGVTVIIWIRISIDANSFSQKKKRLWQAFLTKFSQAVIFILSPLTNC